MGSSSAKGSGLEQILYAPKGVMSGLKTIAWWLFPRDPITGEYLPPEQAPWFMPMQPYEGLLPGQQPIPDEFTESLQNVMGLQDWLMGSEGPMGAVQGPIQDVYQTVQDALQQGNVTEAIAPYVQDVMNTLGGLDPNAAMNALLGPIGQATNILGGMEAFNPMAYSLEPAQRGLETLNRILTGPENPLALMSGPLGRAEEFLGMTTGMAGAGAGMAQRGMQFLEQAGQALFPIAQGGLTKGLEQAAERYYESLKPLMTRDIAQTLEQTGLGGARYSSGAQRALSDVEQQFYSNYMKNLMQAAQTGAELQTRAALGTPELGRGAAALAGTMASLGGLGLGAAGTEADIAKMLGQTALGMGSLAGQYTDLSRALAQAATQGGQLQLGTAGMYSDIGRIMSGAATTGQELILNQAELLRGLAGLVGTGAAQTGQIGLQGAGQYGDIARLLGQIGIQTGQLGAEIGRIGMSGAQSMWEMIGQGIAAPYQEYLRQSYYPMELMQTLISALRPRRVKQESSSSAKGGCCFIFLEAYDGKLPWVVRAYRDQHMTPKNRRGYYRLADKLVPLMRKSRAVKHLVRFLMTKPMTFYGKYFYKLNPWGVLAAPITAFWLLVFDLMGRKAPYVRSNGEVV